MRPINFSVSNQNSDVFKILEQTKNKSDYICSAIREKFAREQSEISANLTEAQKESLKKTIRETLVEMFGDNICLFGNMGGMVVPTPQKPPSYLEWDKETKSVENREKKSEEIREEPHDEADEEKMDTLAGIFNSL